MTPAEQNLTSLERAVLDFICGFYPTEAVILRTQLSQAGVRERRNTGHGFFTHLEVDRAARAISDRKPRDMRDGPLATVEGIEHPMGFILWLRDGYADCLEGYCFGGDDTKRWDLENLSFELSALHTNPSK